MVGATSSAVIDDFIENYNAYKHMYKTCAEAAKRACESELERATLPAIVTYRAKDKSRLLAKLHQRNKTENYQNKADILKDIKDFAGVRIAVYFPNHKAEVGVLLGEIFEVLKHEIKSGRDRPPNDSESQEIYKKRFYDYQGDHYHVKFNDGKSPVEDENPLIEIQVVTVISNAWSQVEHDIVYKKISGEPSKDEQRILDGFNGLVNMGELLLEQLHETYQNRIDADDRKFADEYELGSFLRKWIPVNSSHRAPTSVVPVLGPVPCLYIYLQTIKLETPGLLYEALEAIKPLPDSVFSNYDRSMPDDHNNFSIYTMIALVKQPRFAKMITRARQGWSDSLEQDQVAEAIAIIASSVIWLHDFFPTTSWRAHLFSNAISDADKASLKWFVKLDDPGVALSTIWQDGEVPTEEELANIEGVWKWLKNHRNEDVKFVFDLSCLGMRKAANSLPQLRSIGADLSFYGLLS